MWYLLGGKLSNRYLDELFCKVVPFRFLQVLIQTQYVYICHLHRCSCVDAPPSTDWHANVATILLEARIKEANSSYVCHMELFKPFMLPNYFLRELPFIGKT